VVAALLACLELAKQQVLKIEQVKRFGSIWLFPGERIDDPVDDGPSMDTPAKELAAVERNP
jgi:chromatin segregation and condensation protein Rec8/ScpA/Scc1 (kleisin family)